MLQYAIIFVKGLYWMGNLKYAIIFPGQGAQEPGMGREIFENYPAARQAFEEADEALGFSLSDKIFNGTQEELGLTEITQPAILTVSIAAFRALSSELGETPVPLCMAGHSLGEYTALVASGVISMADGVRLVSRRGNLMQNAVPVGKGAMAAVLGLSLEEVSKVCAKVANGQVVAPANINLPTQIVISGHTDAVMRALDYITKNYTARTRLLKVSCPCHSALLELTATELEKEFMKVTSWSNPSCPIISNVSGTALSNVEDIKRALYKQIYFPVQWVDSVLEMEKLGVENYIELGPGKVLSSIVKKLCSDKTPIYGSTVEKIKEIADLIRSK